MIPTPTRFWLVEVEAAPGPPLIGPANRKYDRSSRLHRFVPELFRCENGKRDENHQNNELRNQEWWLFLRWRQLFQCRHFLEGLDHPDEDIEIERN